MPKSIPRTYSSYSRDALSLLGGLIRITRKAGKFTAQEVAERAGISRGLLQRIEKGDPKCAIGVVFEVATLLGLKLYDADQAALAGHLRHTEDKLALLPKSVRKTTSAVDDDF